jgi:predicted fused transcriptional regulator/phosphomethylpyrimidine kinase
MILEKTPFLLSLSLNGITMKDPGRERSDVLEKLTATAKLLERSVDIRLIPEKGAGIAYAISGARDKNGVAAVQGGIALVKGKPHIVGPCAFGAEESIARTVLTVMKFDPRIRCVATLRFSEPVLQVIESLLLECSKFDPVAEPAGISSMDWGVASCCREGVPDICYDTGSAGKEGIFRFFAEDPVDVTNNIIMISNRIISIEL